MKIVSKTDLRVATLWGAVVNLKANEVREVGEKLGIYALQMGARQVGAEPVVEPEVVSEIPEEIVEEDDEHQVFFSASGVSMQFVYMDFDGNGNPLGTQFVLAPLTTGEGSIIITLIHEPDKPNDNTLNTAGGSIEIQTTFPVTVE